MSPASFPSRALPSPLGAVLLYLRIGRKASLLVQLLLTATMGLATAFVPSFEFYMVLRFAVATAISGFIISTVTLSEYLGPACGGLARHPKPEAVTMGLLGQGLRPPC